MKKFTIILIIIVLNLCSATFASEKLLASYNLASQLTSQYGNIILEMKKESSYDATVIVTAYSAGDDYTPGIIMASGKKVYVGAVAYNNAPLGTIIEMDDKCYTVEDRVLKDGVVDIYMDSKKEALQFGKKEKIIKIRK